MKNSILFIPFTFLISIANGQSNIRNTNLVQDITEEITESLAESSQSDLPEELIKLSSNPIDLNSDDIDLLILAGLLTAEQINAIKKHIANYGKLVEPEELQLIDKLDKKSIQKILPYVIVYSKKQTPSASQLTLRYQTSLIGTENYYNGSLSRVLARFRSNIGSSLRTGFTLEKDEGEEMFSKNTPAFDFHSFHLLYSGNKIIRKIIIGDYNLEFGQGLSAWSGMSFGNFSQVTSAFKYGRGIIPYSGTDENRFFRGAAIAFQKRNLMIDTWLSIHSVDANIVTDTVSGLKYATSFQYSGYHRSFSERQDLHSQTEYAAGFHLKYKLRNAEIGSVASGQKYSIPVLGNGNPYTAFAFRGNENINTGIYYSVTVRNIILFGEESVCSNGSLALINGLIVSADPKFSFGLLYRNYSRSFHNFKSNAFGINSQNSNEKGLYLTLNYALQKQIIYSAFINTYSFPFLKYKVDAPSEGSEMFHQLEFKPSKKFIAQVRYRERRKQENSKSENASGRIITEYVFRSLRIGSTIKIDNAWTYGMRLEFSGTVGNTNGSSGTMISQDIFYHPMGKKYSFNARYSVFNCPEFESRIYEYENDVQGAFSVPFYYGKGNRFYVNANFHIGSKINLSIRYSITVQEDSKNYTPKNDIKIQLRLNL